MNTVTVWVQRYENIFGRLFSTDDVNLAMEAVHDSWNRRKAVLFEGPFGTRRLEPPEPYECIHVPIEYYVNQLPDDSQSRHDRNRARWK